MTKDAYYFPHDSNAKDDPKCVLLIEQMGLEGYGIYWVLIETLRDQPEYRYPLKLLPALARRYNTTVEKIRSVVTEYDLFETDDEYFLSPSLKERMIKYDEKKEKARESARLRWQRDRKNKNEAVDDGPQVFILLCYSSKEAFLKIGSTTSQVSRRFTSDKMPYDYKILAQYFTDDYMEVESELNEKLKDFKYTPKNRFHGDSSCYILDGVDILDGYDFKGVEASQKLRSSFAEAVQDLRRPKKEKYSQEVETIYDFALTYFPKNLHPSTEKKKDNWKDTIDKLLRIDKHDKKEICRVIKWARQNEFWSKNFLSINKLRQNNKDEVKYYEVFKNQMDGSKTPQKENPNLKKL